MTTEEVIRALVPAIAITLAVAAVLVLTTGNPAVYIPVVLLGVPLYFAASHWRHRKRDQRY
jgi:Flp pilus assembly protein TadB